MDKARQNLRDAIVAYADRLATIHVCAGYAFGSLITATLAMSVITWLPDYWWAAMLIWCALHVFLFYSEVVNSLYFRRGIESERKIHQKVQIEIEQFAIQSQMDILMAARAGRKLN